VSRVLTDDEILRAMAVQPSEDWRRLFALMEQLATADEQVRWQEPQQDGDVVVLGYPTYSSAVLEICSLLYEMHMVVAFDWMSWDGLRRFAGGRGLDDVSAAEAVRLTTAIVRGERFCDGTITLALKDGSFIAALHRVRRWYEHERGTTSMTPAERP
jgi:hypothetical protein